VHEEDLRSSVRCRPKHEFSNVGKLAISASFRSALFRPGRMDLVKNQMRMINETKTSVLGYKVPKTFDRIFPKHGNQEEGDFGWLENSS
jgi:hypothetical protein